MKAYEITAELNLKKIIAESREVAQVLNEFADNLERIKNKYGTETEDEEDDCTDTYCENCRNNYNCIEYLEEQERMNEDDERFISCKSKIRNKY